MNDDTSDTRTSVMQAATRPRGQARVATFLRTELGANFAAAVSAFGPQARIIFVAPASRGSQLPAGFVVSHPSDASAAPACAKLIAALEAGVGGSWSVSDNQVQGRTSFTLDRQSLGAGGGATTD